MTSSDISNDARIKRLTIRLPGKLVNRVDNFASQNLTSRTKGIQELLILGLDASLAGVESSIVVQEKISRDMEDIKALFREVIRAADTSSAINFTAQIQNGTVTKNQFENVFREARKFAKERMTNLKKSK